MEAKKRAGSKRPAGMLLALLLLASAVMPLWGQTADDAGEEELFSDDDLFSTTLVVGVDETAQDLASALISSAQTEIGGALYLESTAETSLPSAESIGVDTDLSMELYIDARPDEDFRLYGRAELSYPFETGDTRSFQDVVGVRELFGDLDWNDSVFFRVGKQTINWGVGRFFSPANLINLSDIDPEDPDGQLEGPLALKVQFPFEANNLYAYILPEGASELADLGVAVKAEFALNGTEYTFGAIYDRDIAPAAMATVSTSFGDFDLVAESTLSYGSGRTFVRQIPGTPDLETYTVDDALLFSGTLGLTYEYDFDESDSMIIASAQYLYNGDGYSDSSVLNASWPLLHQFIQDGELSTGDLAYRGQHYSALDLLWIDIFASDSGLDVNGKVFWIQNYTDMSARIVPKVELKVPHLPKVSIGLPFTLGDRYDEFAPDGNTLALEIAVTLDEEF